MKFKKQLIFLIMVLITTYTFFNSQLDVIAENTQENIIFYKDGCDFCEQLESVIAENSLDNKLTIIRKNISDSANLADFNNFSNQCEIETPGTPLLYTNETCYYGLNAAKNELLRQAGMEIDIDTSTEDSTVLEDNSTVTPSPTRSTSTTPAVSITTQPPELDWYQVILIILAPLSFLAIGYLIITRLKL